MVVSQESRDHPRPPGPSTAVPLRTASRRISSPNAKKRATSCSRGTSFSNAARRRASARSAAGAIESPPASTVPHKPGPLRRIGLPGPGLPPHADPNPHVPEESRDGEDYQRRVAPQQPRPQRQQPAELVDEAGDSEGLEGEASQHVEGVAEQEQPEAGEDPGEILPDEHRGEREGDEGEVALETEHPG